MKSAFLATVFNEEKTIKKFLDSLIRQTHKTNEVIIVDGGSTDKTVEVISSYKKNIRNLKIIRRQGNIATGRNTGIENTNAEIILCSDGGCVLDENWTREMLSMFKNGTDVVAGYYKPLSKNIFQKCLATYTSVMPDKIDEENFLPSSRSVGFKKSAWEKAGKYPLWLDTCEDLYFARELKRKGFKFKFTQKAFVYWPQRKNLKEAFIQFFRYARGDGQARYVRPSTPFLFARYIAGIALLIVAFKSNDSIFILILLLLAGYIVWSIQKNYKYIKDRKAFIYLPLLQFVSDFAVISGMSIGFIQGFGIKKKD